MQQVQSYIESGILEMYVMGVLNVDEAAQVEEMELLHLSVHEEIMRIRETLEELSAIPVSTPSPTVKPFLLATIDYQERLKNGEAESRPPLLTPLSTPADFTPWLSRKDFYLPEDFDEFHARIIGSSEGMLTAIIWIKTGAPQEIHRTEMEQFLILEGSCDIFIGNLVYHLEPGDFLQIPLHLEHSLNVTSAIPCKAILQRYAA